jgi:hypothetical protein
LSKELIEKKDNSLGYVGKNDLGLENKKYKKPLIEMGLVCFRVAENLVQLFEIIRDETVIEDEFKEKSNTKIVAWLIFIIQLFGRLR